MMDQERSAVMTFFANFLFVLLGSVMTAYMGLRTIAQLIATARQR